MLRTLAIIFGVAFVTIGILGFLPDFTRGGLLFGMFKVNPMHNIFHIVSGVLALLAGVKNHGAAKTWFIVFGFIYAGLAALGFWQGSGDLLGMVANNDADNWLHAGVGGLSLYFGFFTKS